MEISNNSYNKIVSTWWIMRIFYGLFAAISGLDKFLALNKLTQWSQYFGNLIQQIIPMELTSITAGIGIVEVIIGLLILAGFTRFGGWALSVWHFMLAANLIFMGVFYDVALQNMMIGLGALVLVWLTDVKEDAEF